MDGTHRTQPMKFGDKTDERLNQIITDKSIDSLKQNPIPFYVKPEIPLIESAQELGYKLESRSRAGTVYQLIDDMEQWENDK